MDGMVTDPQFAEPETGTNTPPVVNGGTIPAEELDRLTGDIIVALKSVYDPEIPADIYELGLIYRIDIDDDRYVAGDPDVTARGQERRPHQRHPGSRIRRATVPPAMSRISPRPCAVAWNWSGVTVDRKGLLEPGTDSAVVGARPRVGEAVGVRPVVTDRRRAGRRA